MDGRRLERRRTAPRVVPLIYSRFLGRCGAVGTMSESLQLQLASGALARAPTP